MFGLKVWGCPGCLENDKFGHKHALLPNANGPCCAGFRVAEIGAGTGGLTREAFGILDTNSHCEMLAYMASDVSHGWAPQLLEAIGSPKCKFEVKTQHLFPMSQPFVVEVTGALCGLASPQLILIQQGK